METLNAYEIWPDADDECIAREDDNYDGPYGHGRCTCGFAAAAREWDPRDGKLAGAGYSPGCAGCDPIMDDCRPYKWGIELFEDEGRLAAVRGTWGCYLPGLLRPQDRQAIIEKSTTASRRRQRAAEIVWDRICFRAASTHSEAVKLYTRWAQRTIMHRYRDEQPGRTA
jgi:hypothetical protein